MRLTIRARLTLWYLFAFLISLFLVLAALAFTLQQQLQKDISNTLRAEEIWLVQMLESEFLPLLSLSGEAYESLSAHLQGELEEHYGWKRQFAIIAITRDTQQIFFNAGLKKAQRLLPADLLHRKTGHYQVPIAEHHYHVRLLHQSWGTIVVGLERETIFEMLEEAGEILIWVIPFTMFFTTLGGWFLAKLAFRPVASAALTAASISVTNLKERLPAYRGKDEFGALVETLNGMIARLEQGVNRLQQFTQDAAHELRTPLTILRGEIELAYQDESTPKSVRPLLQRTLDRLIALSQLAENLLLLSRSDSGSYPAQKRWFRLDTLLQEVFEDVQILAEGRRLAVRLAICEPLEFYGDQQLISRLLLNLCDNALKYTEQGEIELSLQQAGENVEFVLRDTGVGIPKEDLPRIFDRFYRVDKARTSSTGGSGLGLAICKWIVNAHGGSMQISSEVEKGTLVRVTLPLNSSN